MVKYVSFMHQWSYNELRRSTVFAPNVFLYQMANTVTAQVHSHEPSDLTGFLWEAWRSIKKMGWPFKPNKFDLFYNLICTQEYEISYEMAICCLNSVHYLQLLSPSLKLTDQWTDAISSLTNSLKHPPTLARQPSRYKPVCVTSTSPVKLVEGNTTGICVYR